MYDLLKREDINWRTLNLTIGAKLYNSHKLYHRAVRKQWTQASDLPWKAVEGCGRLWKWWSRLIRPLTPVLMQNRITSR